MYISVIIFPDKCGLSIFICCIYFENLHIYLIGIIPDNLRDIIYAITIDTISFIINGADALINAAFNEMLPIYENQSRPHKCTQISPHSDRSINNIFDFECAAIPQNTGIRINPVRNPPVSPVIADNPPLNPANTGMPIAPRSRKISTESVPFLLPRKYPANATANV